MKNKTFSVQGIVEIALLSAIAFALDALQGGLWRGVFTNGGSIGLAMIPILILSYRRGFVAGLVSGFILSFLQLLGGFYAISSTWYNVFLQIMLDYILAYPMVAFAGLFYKKFHQASSTKDKIIWVSLGTTLGGFLKFLCHFLAGILFWKNFDFKWGPELYSLIYNGAYMLPNIIIAIIVTSIVVIKQPSIFEIKSQGELINEKN